MPVNIENFVNPVHLVNPVYTGFILLTYLGLQTFLVFSRLA